MSAKYDNKYYESLFLGLLRGEITDEGYGELERWFDSSEANREALTELYRVHYALDVKQTLPSIDSVVALKKVDRVIRAGRRRRIRRAGIGIAASVAVIFAVGMLFTGRDDASPGFERQLPMPAPGAQVSFVMADGTAVELVGERPTLGYDESGNLTLGDRTVEQTEAAPTALNQLIVPKGRRSFLRLPDGTEVWVNSDSRISFPSAFGTTRQVYVEGEVYMEVARDEAHPFRVNTPAFSVNVLGTSFNICAYAGDRHQSVILASGSLSVHSGRDNDHLLRPDEMLTIADGEISVRKVDASDYTSWTTGVYSFKSTPLSQIGERLERYYGTPVVFASDGIGEIRCSGKLELNDAPEKVYQTVARAAAVEFVDHGDRVEFRAPVRQR